MIRVHLQEMIYSKWQSLHIYRCVCQRQLISRCPWCLVVIWCTDINEFTIGWAWTVHFTMYLQMTLSSNTQLKVTT